MRLQQIQERRLALDEEAVRRIQAARSEITNSQVAERQALQSACGAQGHIFVSEPWVGFKGACAVCGLQWGEPHAAAGG